MNRGAHHVAGAITKAMPSSVQSLCHAATCLSHRFCRRQAHHYYALAAENGRTCIAVRTAKGTTLAYFLTAACVAGLGALVDQRQEELGAVLVRGGSAAVVDVKGGRWRAFTAGLGPGEGLTCTYLVLVTLCKTV